VVGAAAVGCESDVREGPSREAGGSHGTGAAEHGAAVDAHRMPPGASLALMLYLSFLCGVNLVIVIPTADEYAHRLGGGQLFSGVMISGLPFMGIPGNVVSQLLLRWVPFKALILLLGLGTILGNVLYALAGLMRFKWSLLAARCLIGLCSSIGLTGLYIGLTVGLQRRSEVILYLSTLMYLAYAVGPVLTVALDELLRYAGISSSAFDADTAPGWFMGFVYLLFMLKVMLFFEDLPMESTRPKVRQPKMKEDTSSDRLSAIACCASFWYACVSCLVISGIEVYTVNVAQHYWGWNMAARSWLLAGLMLCSGLINLAMGRLTQRLSRSDRTALLGTSLLGCVSCTLLFNFNLDALSAKVAVLSIGLTLLLTLSGLIRAYGSAASTKLVPMHKKASMNLWTNCCMGVGRGAGAIIGNVLEPNSFFPVVVSLYSMTALISVVSHAHMKPSEKAE
jgi:hypothetical protein